MSSTEATLWLRDLLCKAGFRPDEVEDITSHGLKATLLSWISKLGGWSERDQKLMGGEEDIDPEKFVQSEQEHGSDTVIKKLPTSERVARAEAQKSRLTGITWSPETEPSHRLVDRFVTVLEEQAVTYIRPELCTSRVQETLQVKQTKTFSLGSDGQLRLLREHAAFERDFLLPALSDDFSYFRKRMASYSEVSTLAVAVNRRLLDFRGNRLIPQEPMELWTEHSERATLPTILDGFGLDPRDRDALGRWRPEGSDVYSRSFSGKIRRIHRYFVCELEKLRLAGDIDDFDVLDAALQWLRARRGLDTDDAERVVDLFRASLATWSDEVPIDQEDEEDEDPPAEEEEANDGVPPERGEGFVLVTLCWPGVDESSDDSSGPESSDSSRGAEDSGVSLPASWEQINDPHG
eukprot:s6011_g1.t1